MRPSSVFATLMLAALGGCGGAAQRNASALTGGDPHRGAAAISRYGCGSCHEIRGIRGAHGLVGPPLTNVGNRQYIAGMLSNTPDNLVRWVQNPKTVNDRTIMPNLGLSGQDATDIAAYLYSIR
jgi:cytochrome c